MDTTDSRPPRGPSSWSKLVLFLAIMLFIVFMYTFLHEGGHALVAVLSGATLTTFSLSVIDLGAHVDYTGTLTPAQTVVNNLAGAGLPLLAWVVLPVLFLAGNAPSDDDVVLTGPNEYLRRIIHAEGYTAQRDNPHVEETLAPGQYQVILTSRPSPGVVSVYTNR